MLARLACPNNRIRAKYMILDNAPDPTLKKWRGKEYVLQEELGRADDVSKHFFHPQGNGFFVDAVGEERAD